MTRTLVLVDRTDVPRQRATGGIELLFDRLVAAAHSQGIQVVRDPSTEAIADLRRGGPVLVFTQQEGRLSARYRQWAEQCLAAGAVVVEKNVFALPSRHRPVDPGYLHALMSMDGAHRFAWRSAWAGAPPPASFLLLPNPLMVGVGVAPSPRVPAAGRIRLLRAGRMDPVKWTTWEQRLAREMASARPGLDVELTLIGVPPGARLDDASSPPNLTIATREAMPPEDLWRAYGQADAYVHHCLIGETYGNTLAEAQAAGCLPVAALAAEWDCAPMEFLDPDRSWVGSPRRGLAEAGAIADAIVARAADMGATPTPVLDPAEYAARLMGVLDGSMAQRTLPTPREGLDYLRATGRRLGGTSGGVRAPVLEAARAGRARVRARRETAGADR